MQAFRDRYIHDLTPEKILLILQFDAWKVNNQSISSAITNDNDLVYPSDLYSKMEENTAGPNAFADIQFGDNVDRILDVGGGRFDNNRQYMRARNIDLLVWDPYGRSNAHNYTVQLAVMANKVKAATSMSILNVIPEPEVRLAHINTLKTALVLGGKAYFKIWPGEVPLKGSYLPSGNSYFYQANASRERFVEEIELVFGLGNVTMDKTIPNLIVAIKMTELNPSTDEIIQVNSKSKIAMTYLAPKKRQVHGEIYTSGIKYYSKNLALFGKSTNDFIVENRHRAQNLQHEYDKRYGLIVLCPPPYP